MINKERLMEESMFSIERKKGLLDGLLLIVEQAGKAVIDIYQNDVEVELKSDNSPLTQADKKAHEIICAGLMELQPDLPIISEEGVHLPYEIRKNWRTYWLVDPLDGTKEFINRNGEFTVNIALIENGYPVLGVVGQPVEERIYYAAIGLGAFETGPNHTEPTLILTKKTQGKIKALVSKSHLAEELREGINQQENIEMISIGSSLKLCVIASGEADLYPRIGPTSEWDIAAAQCVLEVAGGKVLSLDGKRMRYNQKESFKNSDFVAIGDPLYDWGWIKRVAEV